LKIEIIKMVNERITNRTAPPYRTIIEVWDARECDNSIQFYLRPNSLELRRRGSVHLQQFQHLHHTTYLANRAASQVASSETLGSWLWLHERFTVLLYGLQGKSPSDPDRI
jgi:hypothetical protein